MTYQITSKKNWCTTKSVETLEEAIKWCDKQKTKLGHVVTHFGITGTTKDGKTIKGQIKDYETFGNK